MKIIATTRTLNEAANIDRFCQCYQWTDAILIADGGSKDGTVTRAKKHKNVAVRAFNKRICRNGLWRNPHGKHINFLINWAIREGADWIIFDDVDCVPTVELQRDLRPLMETINGRIIMLYRLYIWGQDKYFADMNRFGQSLYAWRLPSKIRAWEGDPLKHRISGWNPEDEIRLESPLSCLHYFFPDEETVERKKAFREGLGIHKYEPHPLAAFGPLQPLPKWARWK
jgi:glycosyltransferase involved in cell wall biosynthesis